MGEKGIVSLWSDEKKNFVKVFATKRQETMLDGYTYESAIRTGMKLEFVPRLEIYVK